METNLDRLLYESTAHHTGIFDKVDDRIRLEEFANIPVCPLCDQDYIHLFDCPNFIK